MNGKSLFNISKQDLINVGFNNYVYLDLLVNELQVLKTKSPGTKRIHDIIPANYKCPLTNQIMNEPVLAFDGIIYEKSAIVDYLKKYKKSPITNEEFIITDDSANDESSYMLVEQNALQNEIAAFKCANKL